MKISPAGEALITSFEGLRLVAYADPLTGTPTIGWGSTRNVRLGDSITLARAQTLFQAEVDQASAAVNESVHVPLTQGQFDALVSFVFNVGMNAFRESTLLRKLNDRDYTGAADEFDRWNKAGGRVVAGLVRRRTAELNLFEQPGVTTTMATTVLQDQPSALPTRKLVATGAAGAITLVIVWAAQQFGHLVIPDEIASALTLIIGLGAGYLTRNEAGSSFAGPIITSTPDPLPIPRADPPPPDPAPPADFAPLTAAHFAVLLREIQAIKDQVAKGSA